jgi:Tfp pilus assembly protein FimV
VSRTQRERQAERTAIRAAADRLLAGTPLRSASGKLTVAELITESGLRRDVVYADSKDLVEQFQARAKAQDSTPEAMRDLAERNAELARKLTEARAELAAERAAGAALRQVIAELSLELQQAREELAATGNVTRLSARPQAGGV